MRYKISHKTYYDYGEIVNICHSLACLRPRNLATQNCLEFHISASPTPNEMISRTDYFGNELHYFSVQKPHKNLTVLSRSIVEVFPKSMQHSFGSNISYADTLHLLAHNIGLRLELLQYMLKSPHIEWDEDVLAFASDCFDPNAPVYLCVQNLCKKIFSLFKFQSAYTTINTPVSTVLEEKKGVCQDFSHLAIACFRSMGLAARYVSGYLETLPPPGKPKLQGTDASHAWVSVYIPEFGWYDFDPTNNIAPSERHVTIAWGRDYSDVPPLKGIVFSSKIQSLKVEVDVIPIN